MTIIIHFITTISFIFFTVLQNLFLNNIINEQIGIILLFFIYAIIGFCKSMNANSTFGLILPVHPITSLVATGNTFASAISSAIGGYGVGVTLTIFGFQLFPYLGLISCIIIIVLLCFVIPYHNKTVNEKEKNSTEKKQEKQEKQEIEKEKHN